MYKYKVRSNLWPQSATQLHANIQLDSLVTSWPSFYMSYITLLIITIYGCGLHGRDSLATPPGVCALQPLMEALCIVPADSPISLSMRSYCILVSQAIDNAVVIGGSITSVE